MKRQGFYVMNYLVWGYGGWNKEALKEVGEEWNVMNLRISNFPRYADNNKRRRILKEIENIKFPVLQFVFLNGNKI